MKTHLKKEQPQCIQIYLACCCHLFAKRNSGFIVEYNRKIQSCASVCWFLCGSAQHDDLCLRVPVVLYSNFTMELFMDVNLCQIPRSGSPGFCFRLSALLVSFWNLFSACQTARSGLGPYSWTREIIFVSLSLMTFLISASVT